MTDTSATGERLADPGPPPPPPQLPTGSDRFFSWVRGLGIARADGWLGGVCAGIAARLRIDPIIVRGIVVVAALFGLPMLVIYAVSWALLPDITGRIHDWLEREFESGSVIRDVDSIPPGVNFWDHLKRSSRAARRSSP